MVYSMSSGDPRGEGGWDGAIIEEIVDYGIMHQQNLTLQDLLQGRIRVGVLGRHPWDGPSSRLDHSFFEMWAFPDGIKVYDSHLRVVNDSEPEHSFGRSHQLGLYSPSTQQQQPPDHLHQFIHTDYDLNRTYLTALTWHQVYCPLERQVSHVKAKASIYGRQLPKCTLWQLEHDPLTLDPNRQLVYLPRVLIVSSKRPFLLLQRQLLQLYHRNQLTSAPDPTVDPRKLAQFKETARLVGFPLAEAYFDSKNHRSPAQNRFKGKQYQSVRKEDLSDFYMACMAGARFQVPRSLRVTDCPNSTVHVSECSSPEGLCFWRPNLRIERVIEVVGIDRLVSLWTCLLLERQVLIFSTDNLVVVEACECLLWLLEPIRWENIYIPFLPLHLIHHLDAFQPFLIGVSAIHHTHVTQHFDTAHISIFHLDQPSLDSIPPHPHLPTPISSVLLPRLQALLQPKQPLSPFLSLLRGSRPAPKSAEPLFTALKEIFFDAQLYLLNNYRAFAELTESDTLRFDREGYVDMLGQGQWVGFGRELANTMVFVRLCEYHLYEEKRLKWNQHNMGGLFVYYQNIVARSSSTFWSPPHLGSSAELPTPYKAYLNYVKQQDLKVQGEGQVVYDIERKLIKYLCFREEEQSRVSKHNRPPARASLHPVLQGVTDFLLPWLKELPQQPQAQAGSNQLRLGSKALPRLDCLFGREPVALPAGFEEMLRELRARRDSVVDYRQVAGKREKGERASV